MTPAWRARAPLLLAALAVAAATLAAYAGTLSAGYTLWDDGTTIYRNPRLGDLDLERVRWAFTDTATAMRWIPLTLLSLSLTHTLHGLDPFGYHLHDWLLHGAAALALFLLLRELVGRAAGSRDDGWVLVSAAAGALAWSLHPLRVEVVAWANGRGHGQAVLLALVALLLHARAHRGAPASRWRAVAAPAACYLAALLSHPVVVGAAPAFLLLDVAMGRLGGAAGWWTPAARRVLLEKLPFAAAAAAVLAVNVLVRVLSPGRWAPPAPLEAFGLFARAVQATWIVVQYLVETVRPVGLHPAPTDLIEFDPWSSPFLLRAGLVAGLTVAAAALRRRWPWALPAWLAWLALLLPSLGLLEHPMFACDRYTHLPHAVPAALLAGAVWRLGARPWGRRLAGAAAAALLAVLGGMAHAQARVWHDGVSLFSHMLPLLGEHPYRANAFLLLALAQRERGDLAAEAAALRQAEAIAPESSEVRAMLGLLAARTGRLEVAALELGRAVALDPAHADLRCQLAMVLLQLDRRGEAFEQVRAAFALDQQAACLGPALARLQAGRRP